MAQSGIDFAQLVGINENPSDDENLETTHHNHHHHQSRKSSIASNSSYSTTKSSKSTIINSDEIDAGVEMESSSKGTVNESVSVAYFKAGAHWSILFILGCSFLIVQALASGADYWVCLVRIETLQNFNMIFIQMCIFQY